MIFWWSCHFCRLVTSTFHDSSAVTVVASHAKSAKHDETFPFWDTDQGKSMMDRLHQQLQQILGSSTCTRASPDHVRIKTNAFCWFWMILSSQFPVNCQLGKSCCAGTCWFRREAAFPAWIFLVQTSWILLLCLLSSSKISWLQRSHQIARSLVPGPGKMSTLLRRSQAWEHKRSERSHGLSMHKMPKVSFFTKCRRLFWISHAGTSRITGPSEAKPTGLWKL